MADVVGAVGALWRYPVKSMQGEAVSSAEVTERGLTGDRAYALLDVETGKLASAKRPRYWGQLLECRAAFVEETRDGAALPAVAITLANGSEVRSDDPDADRLLSEFLDRKVTLTRSVSDIPMLEEVWIEEKDADPYGPVVGAEGDDRLVEIPASIGAPPGTFFDYSAVHLVTTSTLAQLGAAYPEGRFEPRRFRPNVLVSTDGDGFPENEWIERRIWIGNALLEVLVPSPRCVMTTLPQGDLPKDAGILRTAARVNRLPFGPFGEQPCVGVYAEVASSGRVAVGDPVARP